MKELTGQIAKVGHIGELARLFYVFANLKRSALRRRELIELANQTAGAWYRYPNPEPALKLALTLGLLQQKDDLISLTNIGKKFIKQTQPLFYELTVAQTQLLLSLLLDDEDVRDKVEKLLHEFRQGVNNRLEARFLNCEEPVLEVAKILQQLGAIEYLDGLLIIKPELESVLPAGLLESSAGLSEAALWKRLEGQRLRGRAAEELVLREERKRLRELGRPELAELVQRISKSNVSAGYDITSFEEDGSHRYIEVKSSTGNKIRFEWSIGERRYAEKARDKYWIYFVPMAYALPKILAPIYMIQDPIIYINQGRLIELPSKHTVFEHQEKSKNLMLETYVNSPLLYWQA